MAACGIFDIDCEDALKITSAKDMNVHTKGALVVTGDSSADFKTGGDFKVQGTDGVDIKGGPIKMGGSSIDLNGGGTITASAGTINLNSGGAATPGDANTAQDASCPELADPPSVVPGHEPWTRPVSTTDRGPYWKA